MQLIQVEKGHVHLDETIEWRKKTFANAGFTATTLTSNTGTCASALIFSEPKSSSVYLRMFFDFAKGEQRPSFKSSAYIPVAP